MKGPPAHIDFTDGAVPKLCKARRFAYVMRDKVPKEQDSAVKTGVLSPLTHPEWPIPVVPVSKQGGSVRLCGDFKMMLSHGCAPTANCKISFGSTEWLSTLDLRDAIKFRWMKNHGHSQS